MNLSKALSIAAISFLYMSAGDAIGQTAINPAVMVQNGWESKVTRESSFHWASEFEGNKQHGECKVSIEEDWTLFLLTPTSDNEPLKGDLTQTYTETWDLKTPDQFCFAAATQATSTSSNFMMASYRTVVSVSNNVLKLEAAFANCQIGSCPDKKSISSPIASTATGWSITLPDGKVLSFQKFQPKETKPPK